MIPVDREAMSTARWTNLSLVGRMPFDSWANVICTLLYKDAGGELQFGLGKRP